MYPRFNFDTRTIDIEKLNQLIKSIHPFTLQYCSLDTNQECSKKDRNRQAIRRWSKYDWEDFRAIIYNSYLTQNTYQLQIKFCLLTGKYDCYVNLYCLGEYNKIQEYYLGMLPEKAQAIVFLEQVGDMICRRANVFSPE